MAPVHLVKAVWSGALLMQGHHAVADTHRADPGFTLRPVCRFGGGALTSARSAHPHSPVDLPAAKLGDDQRDRARAPCSRSRSCLLHMERRKAMATGWSPATAGSSWLMGAAVAAVLLLVLAGGLKAHDYVMHDNDFCPGCHIFVPSGQILSIRIPGPISWSTSWRASTTVSPVTPVTLRAQGPEQGAVLLDHRRGRTRSRPTPRCREPSANSATSRGSEEDLAADSLDRRPPNTPRVRFRSTQECAVSHLSRALGSPLSAG